MDLCGRKRGRLSVGVNSTSIHQNILVSTPFTLCFSIAILVSLLPGPLPVELGRLSRLVDLHVLEGCPSYSLPLRRGFTRCVAKCCALRVLHGAWLGILYVMLLAALLISDVRPRVFSLELLCVWLSVGGIFKTTINSVLL